jgi:hypothetical protein
LAFAGLLLLPRIATGLDLLVYNTNNAGSGSLRQAINDNGALGGSNRIVFSNNVSGTIALTGGELVITTNVTIVGPGADMLTVSGNNASRVFHIANGIVNASNLTIANGNAYLGGAILQDSGTLNLARCVVSNNVSGSFGGGIAASGVVALAECLIVKNLGFSADGVGAAQINGSLTATNCTFLLNTNTSGRGGALEVYLATARIVNCSFVSNNATSGGFGGALINYGTVAITNCTFNANSAGVGGGIENTGSGSTTVRNTIIAGNTATGAGRDCSGTFISGGYNLIGAGDGSTGWTGLADQVGSTNAPLDPLLGPLQNNGGSTPTMLPLPGSPAIDQGNSSGIRTDQRGRARPFTNSVPPATLGDHSDIGAVELNYFTNVVVTNLNDLGDGSLRQAIVEISSNGVITFAAGLTGTIGLTSGEIDAFHTGFSLIGPGAKILMVSGNNTGRVFSLYDGTFNISGLTLANGVNTGQTLGRAGNLAISYPTVVNIQQCRITGGRSVEGAGIWNAGTLTLTACTVDNNSATNYGGGIFNYSLGSLMMTNCTVASNSAAQDSGVYTAGTGAARDCTIAFNSASVSKAGITSDGGSFSLGGSLIASNTAPSAPDVYGPFVSAGYNLVGNTNGGTGFGAPHDQLNLAALIGPLGDYGGPTPTIALRVGSPAIDQGQDFGQATDQRGFARTLDDPSVANADGATDIGAFEVDPNFRIVELRRVGSDVALSLMTELGRNYRAEYTNSVAAGAWTVFTNNAPGNGYLLWVTNSSGANQPMRFYRGVVLP